MVVLREHPIFFLGLKYVQLLFSFLVVVFEISQYVSYDKMLDSLSLHDQSGDWFQQSQAQDSSGRPKIWALSVCSFTILSLIFHLFLFKRFWEKGFNALIEIFFAVLWLTAGILNLDPVRREKANLNCQSPSPDGQFICSLWTTSLIFEWFIFGSFILSTYFCWKLSKEIRQKIHWVGRSPSDLYKYKNNDKKSFVSTRNSTIQPVVTIPKPIQNDDDDNELEKGGGGVPELLLQSGLPADHRMSLRIVLPQSQQQQLQQQQQQQQQDQINNDLTLPLQAHVNSSTSSLPNIGQSETLIVPSKKSAEVCSLHEVPL